MMIRGGSFFTGMPLALSLACVIARLASSCASETVRTPAGACWRAPRRYSCCCFGVAAGKLTFGTLMSSSVTRPCSLSTSVRALSRITPKEGCGAPAG